ncbi:uncharacterized protein G2W53_037792 [Senna tora]|uniref:Uncharacterized protein n=1 Tax=Senna tora TaxID=362788 RepID=A0A834SLK8_9FABA|nr:uncharacterized protein G2W53_037792 [Senna tora]
MAAHPRRDIHNALIHPRPNLWRPKNSTSHSRNPLGLLWRAPSYLLFH